MKKGQTAAEIILQQYFGNNPVDFDELFSKSDHDLLRPLGSKYVGVKFSSDDVRSEEENLNSLVITIANNSHSSDPEIVISDDSSALQYPLINSNSSADNNEEDILQNALGMDIDDFLSDSADGIEQNAEPESFSKVLVVDSKEFLKSSFDAGLSSNHSKKVTMRTLRSGGMALEDICNSRSKLDRLDPEDLEDEDLIQKKELVGTLFRSGSTICL